MARHPQFHRLQPVGLRFGLRQQGHLEAATGHAQQLHGRGDGLPQPGCGTLAQPAHGLGFTAPGLGCSVGPLLQGGQVVGRVQAGQFDLPGGAQGRQLGRLPAVAAGQADPGRQPRVQFGQALGVGVAVVQVSVQRVRGVIDLGLGLAQHVHHGLQLGVVARHVFQG